MQENTWAERAAVAELAEWARDWERQTGESWAFSVARSQANKPGSEERAARRAEERPDAWEIANRSRQPALVWQEERQDVGKALIVSLLAGAALAAWGSLIVGIGAAAWVVWEIATASSE